jgi:hypothetical protein
MANYVAILKKGMNATPGGKDEAAVPPAERLGQEVDLERRVELLVETTCYVLFNYVAQVGAQLWLHVQDSVLEASCVSCAVHIVSGNAFLQSYCGCRCMLVVCK